MQQVSLKKNFIMNAILTMSSFIFPLITFPYVSRILLPVGTGKVQFATSVITYFAMFAQLGIPVYGVRACAQVRDDKEKLSRTVHELLVINFITSIISYILLALSICFVPKLQSERLLLIIISCMILFNTIGVEWLYKALEQYSYITIRSLIFKIVALVAMFVLIHEQSDYVIYGGITIFASSASGVLNIINIKKYIYTKPLGGYNFRRHMKAIFVYFFMSVATTIYLNLDTVMLGFMKGDTDVGYYNAAVKIKTILVSIVTSLGTVLLPRVSYYYEKGLMEEFNKITKKAINFVAIIAVPMMVYFILFAREGVLFLSGKEYEPSILPMQIIMPTLLLIGLTNIMGIQILVPMGKEKYVLISEIFGAVIDLVLNIILIPRFASAGAAFGTMIAELVVWIVQFIVLRKMLTKTYKELRFISILIATIVASGLSILVKFIPIASLNLGLTWSCGLTLIMSAVIFFAAYTIVLIVAKEPMVDEIKNMIMKKLKKA